MKWAITLLFLINCGSLFADELSSVPAMPAELSELNQAYEKAVAEIREPIRLLSEHYLNRLKKLEAHYQLQGDLDSVLLVSAERKAVEADGRSIEETPVNEPTELVESREIYQKRLKELEAIFLREHQPQYERYLRELSSMEQSLTTAGRIDEAVMVRDFRKAVPLLQSLSEKPLKKEITIRVQVDGGTHLFVQSDRLWFDHTNGWAKAPGLHEGVFPTYIDGSTEWMPVWDDKVTRPFSYETGLPGEGEASEVRVRAGEGRGVAEVTQHPDAENDYTLVVELRDESRTGQRFFGSDWLEIRIFW